MGGLGPWAEQERREEELKEFRAALEKAYNAGYKNQYCRQTSVLKAMRTKAVNKLLAELS
jgi:hypothetical protein